VPRAAEDLALATEDNFGPRGAFERRAHNATVRKARTLVGTDIAQGVENRAAPHHHQPPALNLDPSGLAVQKGVDRPYVNSL
jgi:hypothetical protein